MDSIRWAKIKAAFSSLDEMHPDARIEALSQLPDDIRDEVKKLLSAHEQSEDFISQPVLLAHGIVENEREDRFIGKTISGYLILEKIGSGGMGLVYSAERLNSDFTQKVAIKLIKRGMDSDAIEKRFARERKILSSLKHPNIAQLIDGGIASDDFPFFVMELVEGKPLNQFCVDEKLTLRERLDIFLLICSAVDHAHKNLVIHRDLKPTNIFVSKDRIPKLLDFGIAKLLSDDEPELNTATLGKIFTPEYASPEQILGNRVTTSTDVYSLGVILYELLAGHRPYDVKGKSFDEVVKSVCETEPPRPSITLENQFDTTDTEIAPPQIERRELRGDLDNIVLKALRKDPSERYGSVYQFAEDVSRYLRGLPVSARSQTYKYRAGKYVARHRVGVIAAALVVLSLITGITVASWQAIVAGKERAKAEERFSDVRTLANSLMFEVHDSIKDLPGSTPARKLLVERALNYLDKLAADSKGDMTLQSELAAGYEKTGDVQGGSLGSNLGDSKGALISYKKSLAIRESLVRKSRDPKENYLAANVHSKIFRVLMLVNDFKDAEFHCRSAIEILKPSLKAEPQNLLYQVTSARFHLELGDLLVSKKDGDANEALTNYRKSIEISEAIPSSEALKEKMPDGLSMAEKIFSVTQMAYRRIGQNAELRQQPKEAFEVYKKALEASQKLASVNDPPTVQSQIVLAISLGNVGRMEAKAGKLSEASRYIDAMIELCEKAVAADPQNYLAMSQLSLAYGSLGFVYHKRGDNDKSLVELRKSLVLQEKLREKDPNDVYNIGNLAETIAFIGEVYEDSGSKSVGPKESKLNSYREASSWYKRSLQIWVDLEKNGKLPAYFSTKIEDQNVAIARVEKRRRT